MTDERKLPTPRRGRRRGAAAAPGREDRAPDRQGPGRPDAAGPRPLRDLLGDYSAQTGAHFG